VSIRDKVLASLIQFHVRTVSSRENNEGGGSCYSVGAYLTAIIGNISVAANKTTATVADK
jgi:hypothetical protein